MWIGVVVVVADDGCVVGVLVVAKLIAFAEVGDVISTEPLFRLLKDEDNLFVLAQNFGSVCTVCNSDFALLTPHPFSVLPKIKIHTELN